MPKHSLAKGTFFNEVGPYYFKSEWLTKFLTADGESLVDMSVSLYKGLDDSLPRHFAISIPGAKVRVPPLSAEDQQSAARTACALSNGEMYPNDEFDIHDRPLSIEFKGTVAWETVIIEWGGEGTTPTLYIPDERASDYALAMQSADGPHIEKQQAAFKWLRESAAEIVATSPGLSLRAHTALQAQLRAEVPAQFPILGHSQYSGLLSLVPHPRPQGSANDYA